VAKDLAVLASADGTLHALNLSDGAPKWTYPIKNPTFSAPALSTDAAYVIDLKGIIHAVNLADGKARWTLDLSKDPAVNAPLSAYASPLLHNGKLYIATHNLDSPTGAGKTVVVCVGDK
jgi:outer membrane protein assembly factor BamB